MNPSDDRYLNRLSAEIQSRLENRGFVARLLNFSVVGLVCFNLVQFLLFSTVSLAQTGVISMLGLLNSVMLFLLTLLLWLFAVNYRYLKWVAQCFWGASVVQFSAFIFLTVAAP